MAYGGSLVSGMYRGLVNVGFPARGWTDSFPSVELLEHILLDGPCRFGLTVRPYRIRLHTMILVDAIGPYGPS